jgi:hypothetical protein
MIIQRAQEQINRAGTIEQIKREGNNTEMLNKYKHTTHAANLMQGLCISIAIHMVTANLPC